MGALKQIPLFTCNIFLRSFLCFLTSSFNNLWRKRTADLFILSVFPFSKTYLSGFLVFIRWTFSFSGNTEEKMSFAL